MSTNGTRGGSGNSNAGHCAICLHGLRDGSSHLKCGHVFHASCLQRWQHTLASTCPLCRQEIAVIKKYRAPKLPKDPVTRHTEMRQWFYNHPEFTRNNMNNLRLYKSNPNFRNSQNLRNFVSSEWWKRRHPDLFSRFKTFLERNNIVSLWKNGSTAALNSLMRKWKDEGNPRLPIRLNTIYQNLVATR